LSLFSSCPATATFSFDVGSSKLGILDVVIDIPEVDVVRETTLMSIIAVGSWLGSLFVGCEVGSVERIIGLVTEADDVVVVNAWLVDSNVGF